ncbi:MAG: dTDP-4-dehydrorhamnose reductase [Proteobacteria bacterium]|nr:dTDP-4-dehydrorhamnose reductase [Pseudomonadota bacterium]
MNILLLGSGGQVGWELQRALAPLGQLHAFDAHSPGPDAAPHLRADFTQPEQVLEIIRIVQPDVIVNAAAHTAVDKAEAEPELARLINATTPGLIAQEAARLGALLVHYSTDYVFDGSGATPWSEDDPVAPLGVYGRTKLEGEQQILQSGCRHLIFRTSWVYGARGGNFAKTMLRLARERDQLHVIDDQIGAPTGADLLADVTAHAIRHLLPPMRRNDLTQSGIYHLAADGETSWYGYARFVLERAQRAGNVLKAGLAQMQPIPSSAYPTPARRPHNSRLDTTRLRNTFGLCLPHWETGVARMLDEIL